MLEPMRPFPLLVTCVAAGCIMAGCGSSEHQTRAGATAQEAQRRAAPQIVTVAGGVPRTLVTRDLIAGGGPAVRVGAWASVRYVLGTARGHELNSSGATVLPLKIGSQMVWRGWELGMRGMRAGGRREIVIPPALAYGHAGHPPDVQPDEALVVVVDLLGVSQTAPPL